MEKVFGQYEAAMQNGGEFLARAEYGVLTLTIYDDLEQVKPLWQAFEQTALLTPFQTTAWAYQWYRHIGTIEMVKPVVVVAEDKLGVLFIMALQIESGVLRKLSFLGSDLNDFNCPLFAADYAARAAGIEMRDVWHQIVKLIDGQQGLQHDYERLEKMPDQICGLANPMLSLNVSLTPSHAYRTAMLGDWETFYASRRDGNARYKDRANRKKLEKLGAVTLVSPEEPTEIRTLIDTLIKMKSARFEQKGVSNFLTKPGYADFYRAMAAEERGLVHVSQLNVGQNVTAANFALMFRGGYYYVLNSFALGETDRLGPGKIHMRELMKTFIEKGYTAFDFTIGDEPYKLEWCESKSPLYDHMDAATMKGRAALAYWSAFQSTKRYIKQTPALWNAYSKLRGAFGARKAG
ncbi:MAG TPA: GNAT family N-acetyltransferase [Aestuariivirga sp.]